MKGKNKPQNVLKIKKRSISVQKKTSKNKKNIIEMPPITHNKVNDEIDFASNIFKLYSGMNQPTETANIKKEQALNQAKNNKINKLSIINKKENINTKNNKNTKNKNLKEKNDKNKKLSVNNYTNGDNNNINANANINSNINNINNNTNNNNDTNNNVNEQKEDINLLIAQYNQELDAKNQQKQMNNNLNEIQPGIMLINQNQFIANDPNAQIGIGNNNGFPQIENINNINKMNQYINPDANINQNLIQNINQNPNLIQNINSNTNPNFNQNLNPNINPLYNINPNTNQTFIPNINQNINMNQNINSNINQNLLQNMNQNNLTFNQNNNQNINQNIIPNINQNAIPNINQNAIPNINQNLIPNNIQNLNSNLNPNINPNLNQNLLQNINQNQINVSLNSNSINKNLNSQFIPPQLNNDISLNNNNICIQNQNMIPQMSDAQSTPNSFNNFSSNQNFNYPSNNQLIDNVQFLHNINTPSTNNSNLPETPWSQMNLTYEEYEKKRIKEENRKKQEEFRKMLDEQRVEKLQTMQKTKNQNQNNDLPIIISNEKKIYDSLSLSLKKKDLINNNSNQNIIEQEIQQFNDGLDNNNFYENQMNEQPSDLIVKKYQDMLNNFIDEKTKDIEIQRDKVLNDNNLMENLDNDIIDENIYPESNIMVEENIKNIQNINNKNQLRNKLYNKGKHSNKNRTEINMFRKDYERKSKYINNKSYNKVGVSLVDKKNMTGNVRNDKSNNIAKIYRFEEESKKNSTVFSKKKEERKIQQRSRSLIPKDKFTPKSSEVKIKYTIKERKQSYNNKKSEKIENGADDPINKLQNIQNYIKGILNEYKQK